MNKEFKVGDSVKNINKGSGYFSMKGSIEELYDNCCLVDYGVEKVTTSYKCIEKEEKQKTEPFELKEGMKFKSKSSDDIKRVVKIANYSYKKYFIDDIFFVTDEQIDWEATRKLNEHVSKSFYVVYNEPNGQKKHSTYEEALEEAKSKFEKHPNSKLCIMECKAEISGKININVKELI